MLSTRPTHLRSSAALQPWRGRRAVVVVCRDDAAAWEPHRDAFAAADAELVCEGRGGPLSASLGRPFVVVCDRYLDVTAAGPELDPAAVLAELRFLACRCEECPQAIHEPGGEGWLAPPGGTADA
jgi:hypothetical protein